jgi:hypothetical protein
MLILKQNQIDEKVLMSIFGILVMVILELENNQLIHLKMHELMK